MAKQKYQKVRFTGKRTGLEQIAIRGHGVISAGDTISLPSVTAEAWLAVTGLDDKGAETTDWVTSGEAFSADPAEIQEQLVKERERSTGAAPAAEAAVETPLAEDFAPEAEPATQGEASGGAAKK